MNERDFKVGEWYETVNSDECWELWECKEETGTWLKKEKVPVEKFLLLKIFQINDDENNGIIVKVGKFLTSNNQITFYKLRFLISELKAA